MVYSWHQNRHLNSRPSSSELNPSEAERQRDCLTLYSLNYRLHRPPAPGPEVLSDELSEPLTGSLKGTSPELQCEASIRARMGVLRPRLLGAGHAKSRCGRPSSSREEPVPQLQLRWVRAFFLPFSWELWDSVNMNAGHIKKEKEKKKSFPGATSKQKPYRFCIC